MGQAARRAGCAAPRRGLDWRWARSCGRSCPGPGGSASRNGPACTSGGCCGGAGTLLLASQKHVCLHWVNAPEVGEPLTNAHCAVSDSTVRVTAANLLFGHRYVYSITLPQEVAMLDPRNGS